MTPRRRLTGSRWRRLRRSVLDAAGWRCQRCGGAGAMEVHHIDRNPGHNCPGNLQAVCKACHIALHRPPVAADVAAWAALIRNT